MLNVKTILSAWETRSIGRGLAKSTIQHYRQSFNRYAAFAKLETHERKWLATRAAHDSIAAFVMMQTEQSRGMAFAALMSIWTFGIDAPFPVNKEKVFGRRVFPQAKVAPCPTDADIEPLFRAAERDDDLFLKSFMLVAMNTGLRPGNQLMQLRWDDVKEHDGNLAIVAESKPERKFKTDASIIARLPNVASDALKEWRSKTLYHAPNDYLWPVREYGTQTNRKGSEKSALREYRTFLKRHGLTTWVRVRNIRHWVEYRGEREGIPRVLLAFVRGHQAKNATEGGLGYSSNRKVETVLDDFERLWPNGACGVFGAPVVVESGIPPEAARLTKDFMDGKISPTELALRMAEVKIKSGASAIGV
jgi:hypothetical protein